MVCHYTENITDFHDPVAISTLLVKYVLIINVIMMALFRDNDYCLVRDGRTADLDKCAEERKEWRAANNLQVGLFLLSYNLLFFQIPSDKVGESSAWCTVLFVVTLVLSFLLVTSCFCMCWMKRNLDSSFIEVRQMFILNTFSSVSRNHQGLCHIMLEGLDNTPRMSPSTNGTAITKQLACLFIISAYSSFFSLDLRFNYFVCYSRD